MKLFTISDRGDDYMDGDCAWWVAVWADTQQEAIEYALDHYGGEANDGEEYLECYGECELRTEPKEDRIHLEHRPEVLREAYFKFEGEDACESCGLYPYGMKKFAICENCGDCPECQDGCEYCGDTSDDWG